VIAPTLVPYHAGLTSIGIGFLWLAAILTLWTGYDYLKAALRHAVDW
jgi:phosphatidylglycerophosphate synthase